MSTLVGNICLVLAALLSKVLISSALGYKPPHGGSGGVAAFPIWMLLLHVAWLALMGISVVAIARKGGWDWVSSHGLIRNPVVAAGLLTTVFTLLMCSMSMEHPQAEPTYMQLLFRVGLVAIPVLSVAAGFMLVNDTLREAVPAQVYQWPLALVFCASLLCVGATTIDWLRGASQGLNASQQAYENAPTILASRLKEVAEYDVQGDMLRILEFTGANYPPELRAAASAKFKTHPHWERELQRLLENDYAEEAFKFLSINAVEHKEGLPPAILAGAFSVANSIRASIQGTSPSEFYADRYLNDIEAVLHTVDLFQDMGVAYLPAVQAIRAALDEPRPGKKSQFDGTDQLDAWIRLHGK